MSTTNQPVTTSNIEASIPYNPHLADQLKGAIVLIKYGGNAMVDDEVKRNVIAGIASLKKLDIITVVVHGGGRAIRELLERVGIESEFIGGHRKTDAETMRYVEMALTGSVNQELVRLLNSEGIRAVGLSGKDGAMVTACKRRHPKGSDEGIHPDLGFVGDVAEVNTDLLHTIIDSDCVPVISPVAMDKNFDTFNINADMFAGHMAGALKASRFIVLTDVDGLLADKDDPSTLISALSVDEAKDKMGAIIQGGMIPKIESCLIALNKGVGSAHIINGTTPHSLIRELLTMERTGTMIKKA